MSFQMPATRKFTRGRASGGIIIFIHKSLDPKILVKDPHWIKICLTIMGEKLWWIASYLSPLIRKAELSNFKHLISKPSSLPILLTGDLNARIGTFSNRSHEIAEASGLPLFTTRLSKDTILNSRGK